MALWRPMHYTLKSDARDPPLAENSRKVWKLKLNRTSRAGIPNGNATVKLRHLVVDQATRHHENPKHHLKSSSGSAKTTAQPSSHRLLVKHTPTGSRRIRTQLGLAADQHGRIIARVDIFHRLTAGNGNKRNTSRTRKCRVYSHKQQCL